MKSDITDSFADAVRKGEFCAVFWWDDPFIPNIYPYILKDGTLYRNVEYLEAQLKAIKTSIDKSMQDIVDKPKHYRSHTSGVECIDITEKMSFNVGNAFKYLFRCGLKGDPLVDLRKALFYVEREMGRREFLWFRFESSSFDARCDGSHDIAEVLRWESRYCGHMTCALERLYTAAHHPRWIDCLADAGVRIRNMIAIEENRRGL